MLSGNEPFALSAAKGKHLHQASGRYGSHRCLAALSMTRVCYNAGKYGKKANSYEQESEP